MDRLLLSKTSMPDRHSALLSARPAVILELFETRHRAAGVALTKRGVRIVNSPHSHRGPSGTGNRDVVSLADSQERVAFPMEEPADCLQDDARLEPQLNIGSVQQQRPGRPHSVGPAG